MLRNEKMQKIFIIFILFFVMNCKEKNESVSGQNKASRDVKQITEIKALSLFLLGKVESGTRIIRRGEVVSLENGLKTGVNSMVDVQVMGNKLNPVVRLHENTNFSMKAVMVNGEVQFKGYLAKGTVLVNMEKMKQDTQFVIKTPTMTAEFRGTEVLVSALEDGSTVAKLNQGSVAIKMNVPIVDSISEALPEEPLSMKLNQELKDVEVVMEPGQEVIISKADAEKVIKEKKLDAFVNSPEIAAVIAGGEGDSEKLNSAIEGFKAKNPEFAIKEEDTKPMIRESIKLLGLKEKDKEKISKEFIELKGIDREKLNTSDDKQAKKIADEYLKEQRTTMVKRIEISLGKKSEGVTLKSGQTINGVIFQLHDQLRVITPEGESIIPMNSVKSYSF